MSVQEKELSQKQMSEGHQKKIPSMSSLVKSNIQRSAGRQSEQIAGLPGSQKDALLRSYGSR